jgi:hypothetical protein
VAFSHLRASQIPKIKAVDNYRNENNSFTTRISQNFRRHVRMARCRRERYVEASSMVDDVFRSYRNHNIIAREGSETSRSDLLAELALLTGQGERWRPRQRILQAREDDTSPERHHRGEDHYVALLRRQPSPVPREHGKQKKPPSNRHSSRTAAKFNGFPGEASDHPAAINKLQYSDAGQQTSPGRKDRQPVLPRPRAATFFPTVSDDRHDGEMQSAETDETHGVTFYDCLPSPHWRLVMVIALGLAWLGVASALSYFVVFGGGVLLPTLPPLVAADNGPKEIVPNYGDARTSNSSQTSMVSASSSEKFASRWPADNPEALISSDPTTLRPAPSAPPPAVAPPAVTAPSVPASEPKKVHTIIIRSDGSEQTDTSAAAVAHSPTSARAPGMR